MASVKYSIPVQEQEIEKHQQSLTEEARLMLNRPAEERIRYIREDKFIKYSKAVEILELMEEILNMPKVVRPQCLLIYGDSGSGKTSLLRYFEKLHMPSEDPYSDTTGLTVLVAESPNEPKVSMLYDKILISLGVPYRSSDNVMAKESRVLHYMDKLEVKMLIIDEFHNILNGTATQQRKVLSAIKSLTNMLRIPVVLAGTKDALIAIESEDETKRRFLPKLIPRWKKDKEFGLFLKTLETTLPLKYPSYIWKDQRIIDILLEKSEGILSEFVKIVKRAAVLAIKQNTERIDYDTILRSLQVIDRDREMELYKREI